MLKKSRAAKEFHPAGHSCCFAANGSCVILATQVFAMSQPFTLKADSRDVHKKHMYVFCKLKLGPQIICFRWWQSRFLGGMGWRGRDRGVKQRLTALVSQNTTCFATYLSKTNWAVVQHIFVFFLSASSLSSLDEYNPNCSKWGYCVNLPVFGSDGPGISKVCLFVYLFISVLLFVCLFFVLFVCLFVFSFFYYLFLCFFIICLSLYLFVCLFVCLFCQIDNSWRPTAQEYQISPPALNVQSSQLYFEDGMLWPPLPPE